VDEKFLLGIRLMRALSATIEVTAALLLFQMTDIRSMLRLNSLLGLVGPLIFITVSALGIVGSLDEIRWPKLLLVLAGVSLVVIGTKP
jgi:hypothetical protein